MEDEPTVNIKTTFQKDDSNLQGNAGWNGSQTKKKTNIRLGDKAQRQRQSSIEDEEGRKLINISPDSKVEYHRDMRYSSYPDPPKKEMSKFVKLDYRFRHMRNSHLRHTMEVLPTASRNSNRNRISFDPTKDNIEVALENMEPDQLNTDRMITDRLSTDRKSNTFRFSMTN